MASGAPGQKPRMLATNPRIMKISTGAKVKLLRASFLARDMFELLEVEHWIPQDTSDNSVL